MSVCIQFSIVLQLVLSFFSQKKGQDKCKSIGVTVSQIICPVVILF